MSGCLQRIRNWLRTAAQRQALVNELLAQGERELLILQTKERREEEAYNRVVAEVHSCMQARWNAQGVDVLHSKHLAGQHAALHQKKARLWTQLQTTRRTVELSSSEMSKLRQHLEKALENNSVNPRKQLYALLPDVESIEQQSLEQKDERDRLGELDIAARDQGEAEEHFVKTSSGQVMDVDAEWKQFVADQEMRAVKDLQSMEVSVGRMLVPLAAAAAPIHAAPEIMDMT